MPDCPRCGATDMRLRRRRRDGHQFWGCKKYPKCKGTRDFEPDDDDTDDPQPDDAPVGPRRPEIVDAFVPDGFAGPVREFLQASGRLAETEQGIDLPARWTHACVSLPPQVVAPRRLDRTAQVILHIAQGILTRGQCPPIERGLAEDIGTTHVEAASPEGVTWTSPDGSNAEETFLTQIAPRILGPKRLCYLHVQVPFRWLVDSVGNAADTRRVDFAVFGPQRAGKAVVIEIDGQQHDQQTVQDENRDADLTSAEHSVHRIPVREIEVGTGPELARLQATLEQEIPEDIDVENVAPVVISQTIAALIHAVHRGALNPEDAEWVFRTEGPFGHDIELGIQSFERLLRALETLYDGKVLPAGGCRTDQGQGAIPLLWSNEYPWFVDCPDELANGIVVRPTWLPGMSTMLLPPAGWCNPNPEVDESTLCA